MSKTKRNLEKESNGNITQASEMEISLNTAFFTQAAIHLRSLGISAGDYRVGVMREVQRILSECRGHQLKAAKVGLERLKASRLITLQEQKALGKICEAVFAAQRGKMKTEEAFAKVRAIYDQMLVDTTTSPVTLAIASIASSGSVTVLPTDVDIPEGALAAISRSDKVDLGIVGGAITGALVGLGSGGGLGGAVIGAVIGGIAGGIATACATDEDSPS